MRFQNYNLMAQDSLDISLLFFCELALYQPK